MTVLGVIKLAPREVGYYDDLTRIHLTIRRPEAEVLAGMNTTNLRRAVQHGIATLISGGFDLPEINVQPAEAVEVDVVMTATVQEGDSIKEAEEEVAGEVQEEANEVEETEVEEEAIEIEEEVVAEAPAEIVEAPAEIVEVVEAPVETPVAEAKGKKVTEKKAASSKSKSAKK